MADVQGMRNLWTRFVPKIAAVALSASLAAVIGTGLLAAPAGAARPASSSAHAATRTHRFTGVKRGPKVVFKIRGLRRCSVTSGGVEAHGSYRSLRHAALRRAVVHGVLRMRMDAHPAVLSIACRRGAIARVANAGGSRTPSSTISQAPDGPSAPSGGWSVAYGDGFRDPICGAQGTSVSSGNCDNTWYPNRNTTGCEDIAGYNPDEMEQFNCSQVNVGSEGLDLSCTHADGMTTPSGDAATHYMCGTVQSQDTSVPSGYKFFNWKPGQGQEWAVQIVARFPPNTGEADPGWWSSDWAWTEEIDFFEAFGLQAGHGGSWCNAGAGSNGYVGTTMPTWIYNTQTGASLQAESSICHDLRFNPASSFHTYTTVFYPNNTFTEYVDGKRDDWSFVPQGGSSYTSGATVAGPVPSTSNATMGMILSYGLRDDVTGDPDPYFSSGTRNFLIRSIAVYQNASAGGANAFNRGLAPGTTLG